MRLKTMLYPLVKIMSKFLFSILFLSHLFDVLASSEAPRTYLQKKNHLCERYWTRNLDALQFGLCVLQLPMRESVILNSAIYQRYSVPKVSLSKQIKKGLKFNSVVVFYL